MWRVSCSSLCVVKRARGVQAAFPSKALAREGLKKTGKHSRRVTDRADE